MIDLKAQYLAAGANRHPSTADWDVNGVLAYGADRNIALWRPQVSLLWHMIYMNLINRGPYYRNVSIPVQVHVLT